MNDYSKITALYSRLSVGNAMEIFRRNNVRFIAVNNGIDNEMPEVPLPAHHGRGFTHADRFGGPKFISSTRKRSRENQKERLQYLATGTVGTASKRPQARFAPLFLPITHSQTNIITLNPNFYGRPHPPSKIKGIYTHSTMRIYAFFHTNIKQLAAKSTYPPTASPWASNPGYTSSRLPHKVPYALPLSHY